MKHRTRSALARRRRRRPVVRYMVRQRLLIRAWQGEVFASMTKSICQHMDEVLFHFDGLPIYGRPELAPYAIVDHTVDVPGWGPR